MKKIKNLWLRAILGLTLVLGVGYFVVNASENKVENPAKVLTVFHYNSEDVSPGAFADIDNWEEGPAPVERPCGNGTNKPCTTEALDETDLAAMLSGRSNSSILSDPLFTKRK